MSKGCEAIVDKIIIYPDVVTDSLSVGVANEVTVLNNISEMIDVLSKAKGVQLENVNISTPITFISIIP